MAHRLACRFFGAPSRLRPLSHRPFSSLSPTPPPEPLHRPAAPLPWALGLFQLMAVPKRKVSRSKKGIRNGPKALKPQPVIIRCKCGRPLSHVTANIQELLFKNQKGDHSSNNGAVQEQIIRLAQEVRELYRGSQIIRVVNASDQDCRSLTSYLIRLAILGAVGYGYMKWKGLTFSDVMYVTKRNMENAISTLNKKLEKFSESLTAAKKHLTQRMDKLNDKLDEHKEITCAIQSEVGKVHEDLTEMGFDIESLQRLVENLGAKIDIIEGKQDIANNGVVYLCHFVQSLDGGPQRPELPQSSVRKTRLPWSNSTNSELGCLKDVREALQSSDASITGTIIPHCITSAKVLYGATQVG